MRPSIDHGILSLSGHVSKRAREAALERNAAILFPPGFLDVAEPTQDEKRETQRKQLLAHADRLDDLASRGMKPRAYKREAAKARQQAGL